MLALAAVLAVALAVGVALWPSDDSGTNRPATGDTSSTAASDAQVELRPAVDLPQLGLPAALGTNRIFDYSPSRRVSVYLAPAGTPTTSSPRPSTLPDGAGVIRETVTDASLTEALTSLVPTAVPVAGRVRGVDGVLATSVQSGLTTQIALWRPAPHVVASLTMSTGDAASPSDAKIQALASQLVELDDPTWQALLLGSPRGTFEHLALTGTDGVTEVEDVNPAAVAEVVFDAPGFPAGTFRLSMTNGGDPKHLADLMTDADPTRVTVRGADGWITNLPDEPVGGSNQNSRSLAWTGQAGGYTLSFTDAATDAQAVQLADQLSVLDDAQWLVLLTPPTLRTDLVPMPTVGR
jgi:hypothetical protein